MKEKHPENVNFPNVAINAAEELARFKKNIETNFENVNNLSELILTKPFTDYPKYFDSFIGAYYQTYPENKYEEVRDNHKSHILDAYQKLRYYEELEKEDLSKLITFCAKLGAYVSNEEVREIQNRGSCFR